MNPDSKEYSMLVHEDMNQGVLIIPAPTSTLKLISFFKSDSGLRTNNAVIDKSWSKRRPNAGS